jgi:hypothetical protein
MNDNFSNSYEKIIAELGVARKTAEKAMAQAIETAMQNFYKASDCLVDMTFKTVNIVFAVPRHRNVIHRLKLSDEVLEYDILPVTFKLSDLPKPVKSIAGFLFLNNLKKMKIADDFSIWKKQCRGIIRGVILEKLKDHATVDINGSVGILNQKAWVGSEIPLYRPGNVLFFHVSSVKSNSAGVSICLSRSTIQFPALLFKFHLPMHSFVCVRRFIGQKSIVYTDAPVRDQDVIQIRKKVSIELNNEILEMRNFNQVSKKKVEKLS